MAAKKGESKKADSSASTAKSRKDFAKELKSNVNKVVENLKKQIGPVVKRSRK